MNTQEFEQAKFAAEEKLELAISRKAAAITQYDNAVIEVYNASLELDSVLAQTPVDPPAEPEPTPEAIPAFSKNPDATVTVTGISGRSVEAWSYEVQTDGWVTSGLGQSGRDYTFTPFFGSNKVKARYVAFGPGGEFTFEGTPVEFSLI